MMLHKITPPKLCRLCGKQKEQGTEVFKDKIKGSVLVSIINKYFSKEVISISITDTYSKYVCIDCEQKICTFDEFCLMVANVQKQLSAPTLEIDFAEDMFCHLKESDMVDKFSPRSNDRKYTCHLCAKSFRCQAHLTRHSYVHTGERPYICNICNMSFNQQEILRKHKECHEEKKRFQCANCHQSFRYKVSLKSHMLNFHADMAQSAITHPILSLQNQSLTCTECGKQFATKYKLSRHARCHTGERPFHCTFCDRSFSQTGNLKLHQLKCHRLPCPIVPEVENQLQHVADTVNSFPPIYITETEIQNTINETINSANRTSYESSIYIDDVIETMLDGDLNQLERQKYSVSSQEKESLCLKQPETPELLHSLLYDV